MSGFFTWKPVAGFGMKPSIVVSVGSATSIKEHDVLPSEFLSLVWRHEHDDGPIVDWVAKRSGAK
jgi:hypothetical protein